MERPAEQEYAPFYAGYIAGIAESDDVMAILAAQRAEMFRIGEAVGAEQEAYRYEPGKWSIREVFGHLTDAERVFGYRALCISRGIRPPCRGSTRTSTWRRRASISAGSIPSPGSFRCSGTRISRCSGVSTSRSGGGSAPPTDRRSRCGRSLSSWQVTCATTSRCYAAGTGSFLGKNDGNAVPRRGDELRQ